MRPQKSSPSPSGRPYLAKQAKLHSLRPHIWGFLGCLDLGPLGAIVLGTLEKQGGEVRNRGASLAMTGQTKAVTGPTENSFLLSARLTRSHERLKVMLLLPRLIYQLITRYNNSTCFQGIVVFKSSNLFWGIISFYPEHMHVHQASFSPVTQGESNQRDCV